MKVVVIGAGASGLISAIYAAKKENEVILLERNSNLGKKLLITGNGRCNYFNSDMDLNHYNSNDKDVLSKIMTEENKKEILNFFESIGITPKIKNGYYYPMSNKSISIKDALELECQLSGVKIINDFQVTKIDKKDKFIISSENKQIKADKVILAMGSKAYPKTGSDGLSYSIASSLGHTIIKPLPALTSLCAEEKYFNSWSGARCEVKLSLLEDDKLIKEEKGEVQFTNYGVSGICAFNLSSMIARGLDSFKKENIIINFLPWLNNEEDVLKFIDNRGNKVTGRTLFQFLEGLFDYKLIKVILEKSKINPEKYYDELSKKEKYNLVKNLYSFNLKITATKSFDMAQVCSGGVKLNEINPQNMESLLVKNLYIIGETLDVDGDCGGYNLAFAFITGMIAGKGTYND